MSEGNDEGARTSIGLCPSLEKSNNTSVKDIQVAVELVVHDEKERMALFSL
jgi:hypothetical protein